MKALMNEKKRAIWYVFFSVFSVGLPMASDLFCRWIKYTAHLGSISPYMELRIDLNLWMPVLAAILLFVKLMLQRNVSRKVSLTVNLILAAFMVCMFYFVYNGGKLMLVQGIFPVTSFIFILQICALGYDLFFRKQKEQSG